MYAILTMIYGVPWTAELAAKEYEPDEFGFETKYSGSATFFPAFLGEEIWETDETTNYFPLINVLTEPLKNKKRRLMQLLLHCLMK